MGIYTGVFNAVVAHLKAESAPTKPLQDIKAFYVGQRDFNIHDNVPYIWIHLDRPAIEEDWVSANRGRESTMHILIKPTGVQPGDNLDIPYGDATNLGILRHVENVMDSLAQLALLVGGNPNKVIRFNQTLVDIVNLGDNVFGGSIRLDITQRFFDTTIGGRT